MGAEWNEALRAPLSSRGAKIVSRGWPAGILLLIPAVLWYPLLLGYLPDFMDTVTCLYPLRLAVARQFAAGEWPLWLPESMAGVPLAANPQVAVWYPLHLLFYIAPGAWTNGLLLLLHWWIGGWGVYRYARAAGAGRWASVFGGAAFQLGALMVSRVALTPHLYSAAWFPWILWGVERYIAGRSRKDFVRVAGLLCMLFLAGSPQFCFYAALAFVVHWVATSLRVGGARAFLGLLPHALALAASTLLVCAIQWIPTLDFLLQSERHPIASEELYMQALNGSQLWRAFVGFTAPEIEDTDAINAIGIGALLLCGLALFGRRQSGRARVLLGLGGMSWLLAAGFMIGVWTTVLPLYRGFHDPRRALMIWSCAGPMVAALGAHQLLAWLRVRRAPRIRGPLLLALLLLPTVLLIPRLERRFTSEERFAVPAEVSARIGRHRFLSLDPTLRYAYDSRRYDYGRGVLPNLAAGVGLNDVQGYDPLVLRRYGIARDVACSGTGTLFPTHGVLFTHPGSPVLAMLGVRYLVGRPDLYDTTRVMPPGKVSRPETTAALVRVLQDARWPLFEYAEERPRAWTVNRAGKAPDAKAALLAALDYGYRQVAFAEIDLPPIVNPTSTVGDVVEISPRRLRVTLRDSSAAATVLCVAVPYARGWVARTASGVKLPLFPVDGFLVGVLLPQRTTSVELVYSPPAFWLGLGVTVAGIVLLGITWRGVGKRKRRI